MTRAPSPPLDADSLTDAFRIAGTIEGGAVEAVEVTKQVETAISHLWFLSLRYTGITAALPTHILVKWPVDDSPAPDRGGAETAFYRDLAPTLTSPPVTRCLATAQPNDEWQWLVIEDLTSTHTTPSWPERPSDLDLRGVVTTLARVHARWWSQSGTISAGIRNTEASLRTMLDGIRAQLPEFLRELGDHLPTEDRHVLEKVFASSLAPWLRLAEPRDLTIIHGDAHTWNFLFDREGKGLPYLIDWQTWHQDVGARDLAFLMALHWDSSTRHSLERPLLELYHEELLQCGIEAYSFADLWLEYRRCVVRNLTFPIIFWSRGFPRERWRYRLDHALAAFYELDGAELL